MFSVFEILNSEAFKKSGKLKIIFKVLAKIKRNMLEITIKNFKSRSNHFEKNKLIFS